MRLLCLLFALLLPVAALADSAAIVKNGNCITYTLCAAEATWALGVDRASLIVSGFGQAPFQQQPVGPRELQAAHLATR